MENLIIESTYGSPEIIFDVISKKLIFNKKSIIEYGGNFYDKIDEILPEFLKTIDNELTIIFNLEYLNTISKKRLLFVFKNCVNVIKNVKLIWYYETGDLDLMELGEIFELELNIPFIFIEKNE